MRLVAGCMTGTSIDGLDVALVAIEGAGLALRPCFLRGLSHELGPVAEGLRALAAQRPLSAGAIAGVMHDFALVHLAALRELAGSDRLDLVAVHGQTVFHAAPRSWQLFQPAPVAHGLGVTVVHDLRAADLARGGQGAPITPLADWIGLRDASERRVVVNLGGFCNLTVLPAGGGLEAIAGGDVCACNQVLDHIARSLLGRPFDGDGAIAASAAADPAGVAELLIALRGQVAARRSLGTGDELAAAVDALGRRLPAAVVAATACRAIAEAIATAAAEGGRPQRVLLAGGGLRNRALHAALITACAPAIVAATDQHGVPAAYREAYAMAVLGALAQDRVAITLPQVTGVAGPAPLAGCWTLP